MMYDVKNIGEHHFKFIYLEIDCCNSSFYISNYLSWMSSLTTNRALIACLEGDTRAKNVQNLL